MDSRRQQLRERIAETQRQQPPGPARRYSTELKREVVAYALERWAEGATQKEIAAELGLSMTVLGKWFRHARRRQQAGREPFARVEREPVVWPGPEETPVAPAEMSAESESPSAALPERALEELPLVLVVRLEQVTIDSDARAQLRAWLDGQPEL